MAKEIAHRKRKRGKGISESSAQKEVKKAAAQFRLAVAEQPRSLYASQAKKLLSKLVPSGTK